MATNTVHPDIDMPGTITLTIRLAERVCHRVEISLDEIGDPYAGECSCGAEWHELDEATAIEWAHVHVQPAPTIVRATVRGAA